jgi:hypothetical protein
MAGDSHTNFNETAFTLGAMSGATLLAGAMVAGVQNGLNRNRMAWNMWTTDQLRKGLELSEALRDSALRRAETAERELAKLKQLLRKRGAGAQ